MNVLNKIMKESSNTLKDIIIFIVVDNLTLDDILKDNNINLTVEEKFELQDELYNKILKSNL